MDVHFTGFLFDFFGLILADAKAAFFRRIPRDRRERGLLLRLIQVVFSDAAYGFLWRKNGYVAWSRKRRSVFDSRQGVYERPVLRPTL